MPQNDIPIGHSRAISWVSLEGRYDTAVSIDDLMPDADWFWPALEGHCVSDCCGIDAFDLTEEGIRWAAGADVRPPGAISWRPDERGDPALLAQQLDETIAKIRELNVDVVSSRTVFNQLFDSSVFVELIRHIADVLRETRGHTVVTTVP